MTTTRRSAIARITRLALSGWLCTAGLAAGAAAESNETIIIFEQCMDNEHEAVGGGCICDDGFFRNAAGYCESSFGSPYATVDIFTEVCELTGSCSDPPGGGGTPDDGGGQPEYDACEVRDEGETQSCDDAYLACSSDRFDDLDACIDDPVTSLCQGLTFPQGDGSEFCRMVAISNVFECDLPGTSYTLRGTYEDLITECHEEWEGMETTAEIRCLNHYRADVESCFADVREACKDCDSFDPDAEPEPVEYPAPDPTETTIDPYFDVQAQAVEEPTVSSPYSVQSFGSFGTTTTSFGFSYY